MSFPESSRIVSSGDPFVSNPSSEAPAPEAQDEAPKAQKAPTTAPEDYVAEPPPKAPDAKPANPTTLFKKTNPAEAKKVWEYLKREFDVQDRFKSACERAMDEILLNHAADEFISFIEELKHAFPKSFRKGFVGWFKEIVNPLEICEQKTTHDLKMEGVTHDSQGHRIGQVSSLYGDDYEVCSNYNALGMDSYEVETALGNMAELMETGDDVVPFLKKYVSINDQDFSLTDATAYIAPYKMEKEYPGMWERFVEADRFFDRNVRHYKLDLGMRSRLVELAKAPREDLERLKSFVTWMSAKGWKLDMKDDKGEAVNLDIDRIVRLSRLEGFTAFADRAIEMFSLPDRIVSLDTAESLYFFDKDGVSLEEIRAWQKEFDKTITGRLADFYYKEKNGKLTEKPQSYRDKLIEKYGVVLPNSIIGRDAYSDEFSNDVPGQWSRREYFAFVKAMLKGNLRAFAYMDTERRNSQSQTGSEMSIVFEVWKKFSEAGFETAMANLEKYAAMASDVVDMLIYDEDINVVSVTDVKKQLSRGVKGLFGRRADDLILGDNMISAVQNWDRGLATQQLKRLQDFSKKMGRDFDSSHKRIFLWDFPAGARARMVSHEVFAAYEELCKEGYGYLFILGVLDELGRLPDPREHERYKALTEKRRLYAMLPEEARARLDPMIKDMGLKIDNVNLKEMNSLLKVMVDPGLLESFNDFQSEMVKEFGVSVLMGNYEEFLPLYRSLKDSDKKGFFVMAAESVVFKLHRIALSNESGYTNLPQRQVGNAMSAILPQWLALSDAERSSFAHMLIDIQITPIESALDMQVAAKITVEKWLDGMRALMPYSKALPILASLSGEAPISPWYLLDFNNLKPLGDTLKKAMYIAGHSAEFKRALNTLRNYYRTDPSFPDMGLDARVDFYADIIRGKEDPVAWIDKDSLYVTKVVGSRVGVHPWISDRNMKYEFNFSDYWFLKNLSQSLELFPRLRKMAEGGRSEMEDEVRRMVSQRVPQRRKLGGESYEAEQDENLDKLSTADLAKIWIVLHALSSGATRDELGRMLEQDYQDTTTEYGGVFDGGFKMVAPRQKVEDGAYHMADSLNYRNGFATFHFHSVKEGQEGMKLRDKEGKLTEVDSSYFSGPSMPDLAVAATQALDGIVITRLSDSSFDVDFYAPLESSGWINNYDMPVIDLGVYYHDANEIPPDVAKRGPEEKAPGEKEADKLVSGAQKVHIF
jgi:hypothetical protein